MAAFTRKQYSGAARNTTTSTLLTNVGTTVDITATTGWPSIAGIPFYVVINPSSIFEEKCLATISGSTLTLVRAQDDTTASEHPIGSVIYPVFTANDADEANELVSKLTTKGDLLATDGTNLLRLGVGANGYFLKANSSASAGIEWASIPTINNLNDIGDVAINDAEEGDFLVYKNSASAWINETIHFITVSDTEPTDEIKIGDLWYNSLELELYTYYSGAWVQMTDSQDGIQELYELVDVLIEDPVYGEALVYNGTEWENGPAGSALTLENARVISLSGDVSGSVLFDGSASVSIATTIQPNSVALGTDTTGNYMSDLTQGTGVTITHTPGEGSNATIAIGQAVGTSASVTFANITTTGDLVVGGDLTVNGTTTTLNTETLSIEDNIIVLNSNVSASPTLNAGIEVERGTSANVLIRWNETNDQWEFTNDGTTYGDIAALGTIELGTDTTGNYVSGITQGMGVTVTHTPGEGSSPTIAIGQAVGTSASVTFANLTVTGDLTVSGTTTSINTETLTVDDNIIILNNNATGAPSQNAGIEVERGSSTNVALRWNETSDKWEITEDGSAYLEIGTTADISAAALTSISDIPDVSTAYQLGGTGPAGGIIFITPDTVGNSTGMYFEVAPSASQLQRSWATGGNQSSAVSGADATAIGFGSQNTIDIVAQSGNVSATSAAAYASGYEYGGFSDWFLPSLDELQELYAIEDLDPGTIPGLLGSNYWSSTEHSATQAKYENLGDGGQGFSAKSNALYVRPVRAFNSPASGDFLKWSGSYWTNDAINLGTDTTGNYMSDLTQGTGVTITHTPGEGSNATIAIGQAVGTSASVTFSNITATGVVTLAADPESALQAATKQYVDNISAGINFHAAVVAATVGNLAGTYNNGTSGVGATITKASNGSIGTIDGATVVVGSRILLKSQTDSRQNGIYTVTAVGSVSAPWVVTRATDADNSLTGEMLYGDFCFVMGGTVNAGYGYINNSTANPIVLGTDNVTYAAFNAAETITAGTGLNLTTNVMSLNATLDNLSNVTAPSPTDGQFLRYNSASTVWVNDTIDLGTDTTGNYMLNVSAGTGIAISHTQGEGSTASVSTTGVQTLGAKAGNYTLAIGDAAETIIIMDSSSANDLTVPSASAVAFDTGTSITVVQRGTGKTRILAGAGVTLLATPGVYLRARYSSCTLVKTENANEWFVIGDLAAS